MVRVSSARDRQINRMTRLGRHVTTVSTLHELPGGGELIDTPGFRDFVPVDLLPSDLAAHFAGFEFVLRSAGDDEDAEAALSCRFRNCLHREEPGCRVRAAVESGDVEDSRMAAYLDLLADLETVEAARSRERATPPSSDL